MTMTFSIINVCASERTTAKINASANAWLAVKLSTTFSLLFLFMLAGSYQAKAQYRGGEGSGYAMAELSLVTHLNKDNNKKGLTVAPNPAQAGASIFIQDKNSASQVLLKNMQGKMVTTLTPSGQDMHFIVPGELHPGMYMLVIRKNGKEKNLKLLIQ